MPKILLVTSGKGGTGKTTVSMLLAHALCRRDRNVLLIELDSGLRGLPNVTLIPHMGGPTIDRRKSVTECLISEIRRIDAGEEPQRLEISREAAARMTR